MKTGQKISHCFKKRKKKMKKTYFELAKQHVADLMGNVVWREPDASPHPEDITPTVKSMVVAASPPLCV